MARMRANTKTSDRKAMRSPGRPPAGMAPSHLSKNSKPPSGRYLSFAEREEIAILYAQLSIGVGV
ncbi:MAG: hypothetical protein FD172_3980 [Methylocystaceae bacterium]|nr:MAG: hypothetical protein FD172_3980 [Methylocystaceae bacterium]